MKIQSTEFATSLDMADKGQFEAYVLAWSGRADPDGNIFSFDACKQPLNYAGYCKPEVDEHPQQVAHHARSRRAARSSSSSSRRSRSRTGPIVYLYHRNWLWAYTDKLSGLRTDSRRPGARAGARNSTDEVAPRAGAEVRRSAVTNAWARRRDTTMFAYLGPPRRARSSRR